MCVDLSLGFLDGETMTGNSDRLYIFGLQHASLSITSSQSLPKLMSVKSVTPSNHHFIPFSSCLRYFPASESFIKSQFFTSGGQSIGVSASAENVYSGLISFRMDWLDILAVHGTLKSLLPHHTSKASILQCSAFF